MASDSAKRTPWGDKWRSAVERSFAAYSRSPAKAVEVKISGRTVEGRSVDGSWCTHRTVLMLSRFSDSEESALMDALGKNPALAGSLSRHLEPKEALDVAQCAGLKMFPGPGVKFSAGCSCGMRGMCAHAYATLYALGKKIDKNPFAIFAIRGLDICSLAEQSVQAEWDNLGIGSGTWIGGSICTHISLFYIGFVGGVIAVVAAVLCIFVVIKYMRQFDSVVS